VRPHKTRSTSTGATWSRSWRETGSTSSPSKATNRSCVTASRPCSLTRTGLFPPAHVTFDRGHGRDEIRSITTTAHVADLNFPGVYQAFAITREVFDLHGNPLRKRNETVYGITSLTTYQANPADVLAFNRGHWSIENREHHATPPSTKTDPKSEPAPPHKSWPP